MNPILSVLLRIALHGFGAAAACLPRSWEMFLGPRFGRVLYALDYKRKKIARENMRLCLPELDAAARERLLRENYEHYGLLVFELSHMFTPWEGHWREYVRHWTVVDDFENWAAADRRGGGTMVCGGHISNWEMMAAAGGLGGIKLTMTTRHLKPEWLHRWMEKARLSTGIRCVYQPRTMPTVMKVLRAKEAIGFVVDQYMVPPMGQPMKFFGATVDTLGAIAPLARRTGALITPVRGRRTPDGIVHAQFEPAVAMTGDDAEVNQRLNDTVENWIREYPAEWLWVHRRFKNAVWPADRKTQPV